jgi:hypothetical protein
MANNGNSPKGKWAILIYMAVDDANGIPQSKLFLDELAALKNIVAAQKPNEFGNRDVRICLQAYTNWAPKNGDPGGFGSRRFEIDENFSLEYPLDVKDDTLKISMGSKDALAGFIKWGKERCNAAQNLLFLWGHGSGSSMFSLEDSYQRIVDLYGNDLTVTDITDLASPRRIILKEELKKENLFKDRNKVRIRLTLRGTTSIDITIFKRKTDFYKDVKDRDGSKIGSMELMDLLPNRNDLQPLNPQVERLKKYLSSRSNLDGLFEQEIRDCLKKKENDVDILLIMGCCMQMVEFGYELRKSNGTKKSFYYIASEELIYFDGYNYKDSFKALVENCSMAPAELAKRIVLDAPVKNTYNEYERQSLAISCVDLKKSGKLAEQLGKFADMVLDIKDESMKKDVWEMIKTARKQCRHFGEDDYMYSFIDVTWFFIKLQEVIAKNNIKHPKELPGLVETIIKFLKDEYIIQSWIGAGRIPSLNYLLSYGGHGVGIYFPDSEEAHKNNKNLGIFFDREISEKGKGKKRNPVANEFTKDISWNKLIFEYMKYYGEKSNYKGSLVTTDDEKKQLLEERGAFIHELTTALLEKDRIITDVIPEFLLKNSTPGTN